MNAVIVGVTLGLVIIGMIALLKQLNKHIIYGLILCAIGFLYVGFTWTDRTSFIVCCLQAVVFLFIAYFGSQQRMMLLGAGYFLHGIWDLAYSQISSSGLIPPHYDLFCLAIDFTMGLYLIIIAYRQKTSATL
ncbi:MAG: hypothetical protein JWQ28_2776 [Pedobacter sp.]|jgi:hypothetical protein|nr:hypothetical protein [Pedobacter sp.]